MKREENGKATHARRVRLINVAKFPPSGQARMGTKEAVRLRDGWGHKACDHPRVVLEYYLGAHTGEEVCAQCGRVITRDKNGRPIASRHGAA